MEKGKLLLTSTGLSSENIAQKFKSMVANHGNQAVAIITTATEGKENNEYSQIAKKQFSEMGFYKIDFIDLETEPLRDLSSYGIIYVCGGNTFKLLKFARAANFKISVENLLNRNGIYIGVSAGSIILGPSIRIASEIKPDRNDVGLTDLRGLDIIDLIILPHYSHELEKETQAFETKYCVKIERINDSQAILIKNGEKIIF
jgi:dipeptidase E